MNRCEWAFFRCCSTYSKLSKWKETGTVYVHWPYCLKRCAYCNFNKYIKENVNHNRMQKCLTTEVETLVSRTEIRKILSVYFGGGTPSLALPKTVQAVIEKIGCITELGSEAEITLECNPTHLESQNLKDFKEAGVNRVSIGLQSLDETGLKELGRTHTVEDTIRCLEHASCLFPGKVSVDVIFGRPKQTLASWQQELERVLLICDKHISLYQLTLERGTELFKKVNSNEIALPDPSEVADMYLFATEMLENRGFRRYEVSNYSKEGALSKHNLSYWDGTQYIGIGPGAHGRFHVCNPNVALREARIQTLEPDVWMSEVERRGHGTRKIIQQGVSDVLEELLMTSLRTDAGLKNHRWTVFSQGISISDVFSSWAPFHKMVTNNLCYLKDGDLVPTREGMTFADTLTVELLPAVRKHFQSACK